MLEDQNLRNDIKIGEVALTLAVKSFGDNPAGPVEITQRANVFYTWLLNERKGLVPTQYDMREGDELYRAILEHDVQPTREVVNPNYDDKANHRHPKYREHEMWKTHIRVPDGPMVPTELMIGPYKDTKPIKSYVTRNRDRYGHKNLRIKRVERVSAWEEVAI